MIRLSLRYSRWYDLGTVGLALALAACGGEAATTEPASVALSTAARADAAVALAVPPAVTVAALSPDLANAAMSGIPDGVSPMVVGAGSAQIALAAVTVPVDRTVPCPAGGTSRIAGSLNGTLAAGGSGSLTAALLQTLSACGVAVDGRTLLLSSETGLAVNGSYAIVSRVPAAEQTLTIAGTVQVAVSGSRAPALPCVVDLALSVARATRTGTVTGAFCGSAVSRSFTWTAP